MYTNTGIANAPCWLYREELDKAQAKWLVEQDKYEETHLGNFRRVFPTANNSEKYEKFFHSSGSLYQETAAFKARSECARFERSPTLSSVLENINYWEYFLLIVVSSARRSRASRNDSTSCARRRTRHCDRKAPPLARSDPPSNTWRARAVSAPLVAQR